VRIPSSSNPSRVGGSAIANKMPQKHVLSQ
jgi:hypothetical protein